MDSKTLHDGSRVNSEVIAYEKLPSRNDFEWIGLLKSNYIVTWAGRLAAGYASTLFPSLSNRDVTINRSSKSRLIA